MVKAAFLGLGVMGYPMARHLGAKGHEVTVYNRTTAKAEKWVSEHGGRLTKTPAEAATSAAPVLKVSVAGRITPTDLRVPSASTMVWLTHLPSK